jgi:hypothetical protein
MRQTALVALRCATSLSWLAWIESCAALAASLLSEVTPRSARPQQQLLSWRLKLLSLSEALHVSLLLTLVAPAFHRHVYFVSS